MGLNKQMNINRLKDAIKKQGSHILVTKKGWIKTKYFLINRVGFESGYVYGVYVPSGIRDKIPLNKMGNWDLVELPDFRYDLETV